jgi:hypothetical protein
VVIDPNLRCELPPLILHPFSEPSGPEKLAASSRASLMLQGVLPNGGFTVEELEVQLLQGRCCELSMLFYVGKDLLRWAEQCVELVNRTEGLRNRGIRCESFIQMIVENPPAPVDRKLQQWGVHEYKTIFSRALGIHAIFGDLPDPHTLRTDFIRYYHRFADHLFVCRQQLFSFTLLPCASFDFELYSSAEYAKMLEREWGGE